MNTETMRLFAKYNAHANKEMNTVISRLTPEEWERELGGLYKRIKTVCSHVYFVDFTWLKRFGLLRPFDCLRHRLFDSDLSWDRVTFETIDEFTERRGELDSIIIAFTEEVTRDDLGAFLRYKNWKNEDQNRNVGGLLLHFFNHQTHHRGMISLYLELLGKDNDYSNMLPVL